MLMHGLTLVVLATAILGCGQSVSDRPTARLEGRLQIDGVAVTTGSIQFLPQGNGRPASAEVLDGHYIAQSVPLGKVRVMFTAIKETGRMQSDGGHEFPERINLVPVRFRSGTDLDVPGDNPSQDFLLTSR